MFTTAYPDLFPSGHLTGAECSTNNPTCHVDNPGFLNQRADRSRINASN